MWTDSSPRSAPSRSRVRGGAFAPDGVVKSAEPEPEGGAHVDLLSETGPLLQWSKLRGAEVWPGVVARARLAGLRPTAERSRLVLVSGPAGYGKSTLVAQWSDLDRRTSCWLQLGQGDNDPVVLLARIAEALERVGPVDGDLLRALSRRAPRIDDVAFPLLVAELAGRDPFVLVLDDVEVITAERSRAILAFLVDGVPSGSQLVLVTRGDPGVPLGRLRAGGDLVEIGTGLLALDAEETREVAASGGLELSEEAAEALRERTEGWAAGVVLAALSLRGREDAGRRAAGLSGDQTEIADYLLEEVLERQPERLKRFLLGTSVLERMTASLCDAVLGTTDAAASLEALARSNAFVVPLDDGREWYRYHHLFRELLSAELGRRHPELGRLYRRRAAVWCELHGNPDLAFTYAYESGDLAQAGRIALAHRDEFAMRGQSESVRLWLERCTDEEIDSDPRLALAAAWVFLYGGDAARARRFIAAAERWPLDEASPDGASSLRSSLASLRTILAPDGIPRMLRDAELVYASEKQAGTRWLASGCRAMGVAYVLLGRPQEAIAVLREGLALLRDQPELAHVRIVCLGYLAFAAAELGNRRDLQRWAVEATWLVDEAHLHETAGSAAAYTAGALAHQQRGDYTEAARQLEHVRRLRRYLGAAPWADIDLALRCAEVSLDLGDPAGALEFAQVADDGLQAYPDPGTLPARLERLEERIRRGQDYGLTPAELRVLSFLATHLSLQEIADRLYLSRPTVKTHVASIYDKLGVPGRSEAVQIIEKLGLGSTAATVTIPDRQLA
jgi:LuxR family transcriptional regulator, maltose regulon positive regulatory protein